ncbi:hypothetical protein ADUPG1_004409, partial [Aduncisulcus paluster]
KVTPEAWQRYGQIIADKRPDLRAKFDEFARSSIEKYGFDVDGTCLGDRKYVGGEGHTRGRYIPRERIMKKDKPCWNCKELGHFTRECTKPMQTADIIQANRNLYFTDRKAFFASKPSGRYPKELKKTEEGNPQTQRDVSKIIDSIFAGIQYTRKPSTQPNVLLIDTLRNKPDEKKEEEKIISEEEAWGTEFDMFVEETLAKQASRIGKRRGSEIPLVENSKAWGVTPTRKPLTPAPTSDTEKPQERFQPKRNYRRPPPGIRWQDWKEHVDNLCEELEDKPKSEEEDEDQRPEETSKSEEEPVG